MLEGMWREGILYSLLVVINIAIVEINLEISQKNKSRANI